MSATKPNLQPHVNVRLGLTGGAATDPDRPGRQPSMNDACTDAVVEPDAWGLGSVLAELGLAMTVLVEGLEDLVAALAWVPEP